MRHLGTRRSWLFLQSYPGHADSPHSWFFLCGVMHVPDHRDSGKGGKPRTVIKCLPPDKSKEDDTFQYASWGVQVFIQPLLMGKSWAVIIPVMLPLLAYSQPSLALWLSPLCEKCLQWGKALNPFIPQFLHLWICLARWMEENSLF